MIPKLLFLLIALNVCTSALPLNSIEINRRNFWTSAENLYSNTVHDIQQVGQGLVNGAVAILSAPVNAILHPIATAKGLKSFVEHPIASIEHATSFMVDSCEKNGFLCAGELLSGGTAIGAQGINSAINAQKDPNASENVVQKFGDGALHGATGLVEGVAGIVIHPVNALKGIVQFADHPINSAVGAWNSMTTSCKNDPAGCAGEIAFNVALYVIIFLTVSLAATAGFAAPAEVPALGAEGVSQAATAGLNGAASNGAKGASEAAAGGSTGGGAAGKAASTSTTGKASADGESAVGKASGGVKIISGGAAAESIAGANAKVIAKSIAPENAAMELIAGDIIAGKVAIQTSNEVPKVIAKEAESQMAGANAFGSFADSGISAESLAADLGLTADVLLKSKDIALQEAKLASMDLATSNAKVLDMFSAATPVTMAKGISEADTVLLNDLSRLSGDNFDRSFPKYRSSTDPKVSAWMEGTVTDASRLAFAKEFGLNSKDLAALDFWTSAKHGIDSTLASALEKIPAFKGPVIRSTKLNANSLYALESSLRNGETIEMSQFVSNKGSFKTNGLSASEASALKETKALASSPAGQSIFGYHRYRLVIQSKSGRYITPTSTILSEPEVLFYSSMSKGFQVIGKNNFKSSMLGNLQVYYLKEL